MPSGSGKNNRGFVSLRMRVFSITGEPVKDFAGQSYHGGVNPTVDIGTSEGGNRFVAECAKQIRWEEQFYSDVISNKIDNFISCLRGTTQPERLNRCKKCLSPERSRS